MNLVLPQLSRNDALDLIRGSAELSLQELSESLPIEPPQVTYSPVGGTQLRPDSPEWGVLRSAVVELAQEHGMPDTIRDPSVFEGRCARVLRDHLRISPYEASQEGVWSYITCCWLMDVARWRWPENGAEQRFYGDVNRNTFRRLWWRAETFGDLDLTQLGEDEFVAIMERPTLASDPRLARAIADGFLARVRDAGIRVGRMGLMREACKRVIRLTPFIDLGALEDDDLRELISETFERVAAAVEQREPDIREPSRRRPPDPSPAVTRIDRPVVSQSDSVDARQGTPKAGLDFDAVAEAALNLARRTGNVTNMKLREITNITADEARAVLRELVDAGRLVQRGRKRGAHYVLPEPPAEPAGRDDLRRDE